MVSAKSKVIRLRRDVLRKAQEAAKDMTGRKHTEAEAIEICVGCASREAHERLVASLNAKTRAGIIANTVAAVEHLTGKRCDVRVAGDKWWIALEGEDQGFPLGQADPSLVATELATLGRGLDLQGSVQ